MSKWRLIIDRECSASFNMAADKYLFDSAGDDSHIPVLRIYGWKEPSITIGHHQSIERALERSRLDLTPVVKRITGGRALLHETDEITYAIAGAFLKYKQLGNTLYESYNNISNAIVNFYNSFGWEAEINRRDNPISLNKTGTVQKGCMAAVSHYEVIINGQKMAAGSQRRTTHYFLQHGAIKLFPPRSHPAILCSTEVVALKEIERPVPECDDLIYKLVVAFEREFNIEFENHNWDLRERNFIAEIESDFGNLNSVQIDLNRRVS
ncbi:MAG: hypothetical protein ABIE07_04825 [Candidatus Zixiibacteriota bacterium]